MRGWQGEELRVRVTKGEREVARRGVGDGNWEKRQGKEGVMKERRRGKEKRRDENCKEWQSHPATYSVSSCAGGVVKETCWAVNLLSLKMLVIRILRGVKERQVF
ncbi:hypothetical protein E2C01_091445 [Portunus trituberculatus]|uniref:Uncharacterized protein n=1 Tax=Portunus trituberculatus TaxID=210409 RepID=A0A5B7JP34_PORTR|nr:hypothetical protein [Portunus trituberculatus]